MFNTTSNRTHCLKSQDCHFGCYYSILALYLVVVTIHTCITTSPPKGKNEHEVHTTQGNGLRLS